MKQGILRSINIIGTILICVALGYAFNANILSPKERFDERILNNITFFCGIGISSMVLFASLFSKIDKKWKYITQFTLSYLLSFFLIKRSLFFFKGYMYQFSFGNLEAKVGELQNYELYQIAMSHSPAYKMFLAWSMLVFAFLICFRKTRALGTVGSLAICSNIYVISNGYEYGNSGFATLLFGIAAYLALSQWSFFANAFVFNKKIKRQKYPLGRSKKVYDAMNLVKAICFIGCIIYFHFDFEDRFWRGKKSFAVNPIVGVWKIEDSQFSKEENQTKQFLQAEALYFDSGYSAYIKHDDSLSKFKYLLDADADQFDMYDFHALREIDIKGKFELIDSDTLIFEGKNNKDSISLKLIRDNRFDRYLDK